MRQIITLFIGWFLTFQMFGQKINEFYPNPPGSDPQLNQIEIKGSPNSSVGLWLVSIENDDISALGTVDRASSVSINFDSEGLDVVSIPDLEDPSFTLVLSTEFNSSIGDDLDTDNNGIIDNVNSVFGTVIDAIGISDWTADDPILYGQSLGGTNILFNGMAKPEMAFRDGVSENWYITVDSDPFPDQTNYTVHDQSGNIINIGNFDSDPTSSSFGANNPSRETQTIEDFSLESVRIYPNPNATGTLKINSGNVLELKVIVLNILGKQVMNKDLTSNTLNISELGSGVYILKFLTQGASTLRKLVIQ